MNKWIAEFDLEDGDTMPEHMDLEYKGARIDFHCRPLEQEPTTKNNLGVDCIARQDVERYIEGFINEYTPEEELEFINLELDGLKHLPPVTPQEPFINKPCVSSGVCEHDKQKVLDKIRAEIKKEYRDESEHPYGQGLRRALQIIDKYKAEVEPQESEEQTDD